MNTLKNLNRHMAGSRLLYTASWLAVATASFLELLQPQLIRIILDVGLGGREWDGAAWLGRIITFMGGSWGLQRRLLPVSLLSVLLMGLAGTFLYLKGRWSAVAAESTACRMRDRLFHHLQSLKFDDHVKANIGDIIQRCTSDVETIRSFLATQAVEIGRAIFLVLFTALMMYKLDRTLTWISLSVMPLLFAFGYVFFFRVKKVFNESDEAEGRMSSMLQENISGIRVVRAFARRAHEEAKFDAHNMEYREKTYTMLRLLAWYWSISDMICFIQIGLVMSFGGLWAASGRISPGTAVLFFTFVGLLLWPIRQMGRILIEMGKTAVSLRRIQEILDIVPEIETGDYRSEVKGHVEFRNVHFHYKKSRPVLRGLNFTVKPGEFIAILGTTGSGKSTLAQLMPRLYDPTEGEILIDGVKTVDWNRKALRQQICIVLQEPFLFNRTLRENITLAVPDADEARVIKFTTAATLHTVIESFHKGYQTIVGEGGTTLSGGQKQRAALARTLIREPRILIMDDSLSAVDTETDAMIRTRLRKIVGDITVFIIAHRTNTLREADRILVLEKGIITQQGHHDDLVRVDGLYKRIWNIQNANIQESPL